MSPKEKKEEGIWRARSKEKDPKELAKDYGGRARSSSKTVRRATQDDLGNPGGGACGHRDDFSRLNNGLFRGSCECAGSGGEGTQNAKKGVRVRPRSPVSDR